jgi:hypothetical protein
MIDKVYNHRYNNYVGFPGEGYNFGFIDVEYHIVSSAPNLYRVNVRL